MCIQVVREFSEFYRIWKIFFFGHFKKNPLLVRIVSQPKPVNKISSRPVLILSPHMIYSLTAIGLTPGGSNTVHIYTQTIHKTAQ